MYKNYTMKDRPAGLDYVPVTNEDDVVEVGPGSGWYIKFGYAGYNSPTNNAFGYSSKKAALAAVIRYQDRSLKK